MSSTTTTHAPARPAADDLPRPRLRELVPAHCTAGGKALLAARDL
ncbi:MAG TPA: hypothetical protein VFY45_13030 [Baekduia sp.]|nr:hypothetical protein [Baekduia sp.]